MPSPALVSSEPAFRIYSNKAKQPKNKPIKYARLLLRVSESLNTAGARLRDSVAGVVLGLTATPGDPCLSLSSPHNMASY